MKSKRLRQKDLADISGLSIGTVKQYTAGLRVPEKHNLMLLSKALDVSENYLLGVKDG